MLGSDAKFEISRKLCDGMNGYILGRPTVWCELCNHHM